MPAIDTAQSLENLKLERDAIQLYDALASIERDARRADAFRTIAGNERRHAEIWAKRLRDLGAVVPPAGGARFRIRVIVAIARVFGTNAVRDLVLALEGDEEGIYNAQATPEVEAIAADEREHVEIWKRLSADNGAESVMSSAFTETPVGVGVGGGTGTGVGGAGAGVGFALSQELKLAIQSSEGVFGVVMLAFRLDGVSWEVAAALAEWRSSAVGRRLAGVPKLAHGTACTPPPCHRGWWPRLAGSAGRRWSGRGEPRWPPTGNRAA